MVGGWDGGVVAAFDGSCLESATAFAEKQVLEAKPSKEQWTGHGSGSPAVLLALWKRNDKKIQQPPDHVRACALDGVLSKQPRNAGTLAPESVSQSVSWTGSAMRCWWPFPPSAGSRGASNRSLYVFLSAFSLPSHQTACGNFLRKLELHSERVLVTNL